MPVPLNPKIYHITHLDNLPSVVDAVLWSDAERIRRGLCCTVVGMSEIKRRRLEELEVDCQPGTMVGEYVPFYFCPRSIMLYLLYRGNHPEITYHGGQGPLIHLRADLNAVLQWLQREGRQWAFSKGNAGARYASFFGDSAELDRLDWDSIPLTEWRDPDVKEAKQSEFLVYESFPWDLVEYIGVQNDATLDRVMTALARAQHQPAAGLQTGWYY